MDFIDGKVIDFINKTQAPESGMLGDIQCQAYAENMPVLTPDAARLLRFLICLLKPVRILEIGCFVGFSAGLMARYMPDGGHITTIDRYPEMIELAEANFKLLGISDHITFLKGDAVDILPHLTGQYDFILLDAAKGQYNSLLPDCIRLLTPSGVLMADDILADGNVYKERLSVPRRQRTIHTRMNEFLNSLSSDERLESCILTVGGGVALAVKR